MGKASKRKSGRTPQHLLDQARGAIEAAVGRKDVVMITNSPAKEKISYALGKLLQEEAPDDATLEEYQAALTVIVIAWNLSLLDADKRSETLKNFTAIHQGENAEIARATLAHMERLIAKKQARFPQDCRHVVSHNVRLENGKVRILASAILPPKPELLDPS